TFDRSAPEKVFGKILEMVHALSPPTKAAAGTASEGASAEGVGSPEESPVVDTFSVPGIDWDREQYRTALWYKLLIGDEEGATSIEEAYLRTADAAGDDRKVEWEAISQSLKLRFGKNGSLSRLRELTKLHPDNSVVLSNLASAFEHFGDPIEAARAFEAAAMKTADGVRQSFLCKAAVQFARAKRMDLARPLLEQAKVLAAENSELERVLLNALREVFSIDDSDSLEIEIMERIVDQFPEDSDARFSLAYKHSNADERELALHHYLSIADKDRSSVAWNNIGVSYAQLSMPGKSISAYRRAANAGETLAMSNLAYKFMEVGFFDEASAEFEQALLVPDFHRNVPEGLAALKGRPEQEDKKLAEILDRVRPKAEFYKRLGQAVAQPELSLPSGPWQAPQCVLDIQMSGREFRAVGTYEKPANKLISALLPTEAKPATHRIEFVGKIEGRSIEGTVTRVDLAAPALNQTLLSLAIDDGKSKFSMILNDDGTTISVMERPKSQTPDYYNLTRL
ncbi:MAG: tetratricopeptide repeat protein, partial [Phenylobacterium sp.]|uniref:hypothetical protein n=1 Tax=Phenylobacterium sp. TaxID=1871053 RepID=UPI003BB68112